MSWLCCSMSTSFQSPFRVIVIFIYFFVWFPVSARIVCLIRLNVQLSSLSPLTLLCSAICCSTHPQETSFFTLKDFNFSTSADPKDTFIQKSSVIQIAPELGVSFHLLILCLIRVHNYLTLKVSPEPSREFEMVCSHIS